MTARKGSTSKSRTTAARKRQRKGNVRAQKQVETMTRNTPEANAPETEVDIQIVPAAPEEPIFEEDGPLTQAEALAEAIERDQEGITVEDDPSSEEPGTVPMETESEEPVSEEPEEGGTDADTETALGGAEEPADDVGDGEPSEKPAEGTEGPSEAPTEGQDDRDKGGDVLPNQSALLDADEKAEKGYTRDTAEDAFPVEPDPLDDMNEEKNKPWDDSMPVESDEKSKKDSPLFKIPGVRAAWEQIDRLRRFKKTFWDDKYIKEIDGWHGRWVRLKHMKKGYVFLHRIWWDNTMLSYRDDIIFVKREQLTKANPKYLTKNGVRAYEDPGTGDWILFNSTLMAQEFEGEAGFTASSAYLCMLDTSGEKAIKDATTVLDGKEKGDYFWAILIGGQLVIVFAFFMLGGMR